MATSPDHTVFVGEHISEFIPACIPSNSQCSRTVCRRTHFGAGSK